MTEHALTSRARRLQLAGNAAAADSPKTFEPRVTETESAIDRFWRKRGL